MESNISNGVNNTHVPRFICYTMSDNYYLLSRKEKERLFDINFFIALFNSIINAVMVSTIIKRKQYRIQSIKMSLYLSISDLLTALITQPIFNYQMRIGKNHNCVRMVLFQLFEWLFPQFSFNILTLIILDRFMHIKYLTRYADVMTPRKVNGFICIVFGITVLECMFVTIGSVYKLATVAKRIAVSVIHVLMLLSDFTLYFASLYILRRYKKDSGKALRDHVQKITKMAFYYLLAVVIIYVPFFTVMVVNRIKSKTTFLTREVAFWFVLSQIIVNINGIINSILFFYFNRTSRTIQPS